MNTFMNFTLIIGGIICCMILNQFAVTHSEPSLIYFGAGVMGATSLFGVYLVVLQSKEESHE
jgi:hypothetical protein